MRKRKYVKYVKNVLEMWCLADSGGSNIFNYTSGIGDGIGEGLFRDGRGEGYGYWGNGLGNGWSDEDRVAIPKLGVFYYEE